MRVYEDEQEELEAMVERLRAMADGYSPGSFLRDAMDDLADSMTSQVQDLGRMREVSDWSDTTGWAE